MIISRFPQKAAPQSGFTYTGNYEVVEDADGYKIRLLSSGVFTPNADMQVDLFAVGGGSGGSAGDFESGTYTESYTPSYGPNAGQQVTETYSGQIYKYGGGGAGGNTNTEKNVTLEAGVDYYVVIGAGGTAGTPQASSGAGGTTRFGELISATGGQWISRSLIPYGADGGSGGGSGTVRTDKRYSDGRAGALTSQGGNGGSDGSDGGGLSPQKGTGQGSTTREFGDANGALYAGGGAGGCHWVQVSAYNFSGGEGGGGNGCTWTHTVYPAYIPAENGSANTGGGGGGGDKDHAGGSGGSGILIIRNARGE